MSRIGKRPVLLNKGVTAKIDSGVISVKGPKGELKLPISQKRYPGINVAVEGDSVVVTRREETRLGRTQQGLVRALIQNMALGVLEGYTQKLDFVGVGYKAEVKGKSLVLNVGHSNPVDFHIPDGIQVVVEKQTRVVVTGIDKRLVGEVAASVRRVRPPEPYKGKGIRYADEIVKHKVGKAAAGSTGG
ncbi:MAG TPA: 50S ribosomal protein L6 [bacterium]|nr:50S ribosomal protein L6 [bacterium]